MKPTQAYFGTAQALPGTYALVLLSRKRDVVRVGKVGKLHLQPGFYVYVGSALGPGGVRARLAHHLNRSTRPHWHIDYLRGHTRIEEIWYCLDGLRWEHTWAHCIRKIAGASIPLVGFGSTDCGCEAHLYFFEKRPSRNRFRRMLGKGLRSASCSRRKT